MILKYILTVIFILDCIFLILVVLLQSGKGGDVAAAFGGSGSQTAFGPRGAQKPLEKATIVAAAIFMFLALLFSLQGVVGPSSVVRDGGAATTQPSPSPSPAASPSVSPVGGALPVASPSAPSSPAASPAASPEKR